MAIEKYENDNTSGDFLYFLTNRIRLKMYYNMLWKKVQEGLPPE